MSAQNEIGTGAASAAAMETRPKRAELLRYIARLDINGHTFDELIAYAQAALTEAALSAPNQPVPEEVRRRVIEAANGWDADENDGYELPDGQSVDQGESGLTVGDLRALRTFFEAQPTKPTGEDAGDESRHGDEGTEWFWRIVDANGLGNVPSDESAALRLLCDKAVRYDELRATPAPAPIPAGYRLISAEMTPTVMERMAFNLTGEFGADFVSANKEFALAVYAEAYASGFAPAPIPANEVREALEEAVRALELGRAAAAEGAAHDEDTAWGEDWPASLAIRRGRAALARPSAPGEGLREAAESYLRDFTRFVREEGLKGWPEHNQDRLIDAVNVILSRPDTAGEGRRPAATDLARWLADHAMLDPIPAEFAARALLERDDSPLRASPSPDTAGDGEGWLPIETAPKDGTVVDLSKDGARFTDFRWDAEQRGGGAWSRATHEHRHWRDRAAIYAPDHWMARPAMPAAPSDPRLDRAAPSSQSEG